ncbi:MAG TPA: hypothetical protein VES20_13200, partial [Bryobacteraceae bacterium]|nr:hypothetical protein [Bryobacteraceae bacterium]
QKLYPRYEMFLKITDTFRQFGKVVPVFNDKHLSWNFHQANRMVNIARELRFPLLAGSSVPVAFRVPQVDAPFGATYQRAVAIGYSGIEVYGFHMLEGLQAMVERRRGGETGVRAVQCLENEACWTFMSEHDWAGKLFEHALGFSKTRKPGAPRDLVKEPAVFVIEYQDGLTAAGFMMAGLVDDFTVAVEAEGSAAPVATLMHLQNGQPYHHFECLVRNIEKMFETGKPPYPVERTLLTTGILDFALESRIQGHVKLQTPLLAKVQYRTPNLSHFCPEGW